jgi:hypothetical protein
MSVGFFQFLLCGTQSYPLYLSHAGGHFPCFPVVILGMFITFITSFSYCFDAEVSEEIKQQAAERALQIHLPSKEKGKGFRQ